MFKKNRPKNLPASAPPIESYENNNVSKQQPHCDTTVGRPQLIFHCQLAHGSPTAFISGFSNIRELYMKIAESFQVKISEILFCTLNTFKVDMKLLLGGQIGLEDLIFAHLKGTPKEVELVKTEEALGVTITDNGAGYAFVKRIKEGSLVDKIPHIQVGDHIEKLNGDDMVGKKHYEVAKILKDIPVGTTFTIRLIEPLKSGFTNISAKSGKGTKKDTYGTGRETLRFKANGNAAIEEKDDVMDTGLDSINNILESFLGINDNDLARQIWEQAEGKANSMDFAEAVDDSDLEAFGFTDDLIIELWGAITDARSGRCKSTTE